jgi:hypothetical protein
MDLLYTPTPIKRREEIVETVGLNSIEKILHLFNENKKEQE